eukprot:10411158-Lingulodinium_polyedra.AAC.1
MRRVAPAAEPAAVDPVAPSLRTGARRRQGRPGGGKWLAAGTGGRASSRRAPTPAPTGAPQNPRPGTAACP